MMKGVGIDIIEIARIEKVLRRYQTRFCAKLFSQQEIDYCLSHSNPAPALAVRFAAKEAVAKALGTGFGAELSWQDIEIVHNEKGAPQVELSPKAQTRWKNPNIILSMSHCKAYATAIAIMG